MTKNESIVFAFHSAVDITNDVAEKMKLQPPAAADVPQTANSPSNESSVIQR
jgi:hypothetical protein